MRFKGTEKELSGGELDTTNNRMELRAAIEGLQALKRPMRVVVHTDSTYVKDGITNPPPLSAARSHSAYAFNVSSPTAFCNPCHSTVPMGKKPAVSSCAPPPPR